MPLGHLKLSPPNLMLCIVISAVEVKLVFLAHFSPSILIAWSVPPHIKDACSLLSLPVASLVVQVTTISSWLDFQPHPQPPVEQPSHPSSTPRPEWSSQNGLLIAVLFIKTCRRFAEALSGLKSKLLNSPHKAFQVLAPDFLSAHFLPFSYSLVWA